MPVSPVHFSSHHQEWGTPWWLVRRCEHHIGKPFILDVCATADNAKAPKFFSPEQDGLKQVWDRRGLPSIDLKTMLVTEYVGANWLNPPYGKDIGKWVDKARIEAEAGATVVCLLPARTDTRWFQENAPAAKEILFLRGRIHFEGVAGSVGAPFPSVLVIFEGDAREDPFAPRVRFVDWREGAKGDDDAVA